jgi:hypothetical protein
MRPTGQQGCFRCKFAPKSAKKPVRKRSTVLILLAAKGFMGGDGGVGAANPTAGRRVFPQRRQGLATKSF